MLGNGLWRSFVWEALDGNRDSNAIKRTRPLIPFNPELPSRTSSFARSLRLATVIDVLKTRALSLFGSFLCQFDDRDHEERFTGTPLSLPFSNLSRGKPASRRSQRQFSLLQALFRTSHTSFQNDDRTVLHCISGRNLLVRLH
jgi:hypothetical protein